jgi:hypothetical protein
MDLLMLSAEPVDDALVFLVSRRDWLRRVIHYPSILHPVFVHAWALLRSEPEPSPRRRDAIAFLENLVSHLHSASVVADLCEALPARQQAGWLDYLVFSYAADIDLIGSLVCNEAACARLPRGGWRGHAIFVRGTMLMNDAPGRQFEIDELVPLGVEADHGSSRALLGAAFDGEQLTERAVDALLTLFPGDAYLTGAIEKKRRGAP